MDNSHEELRLTISVLQIQRNAASDLHAQVSVMLSMAQRELEQVRNELREAQARIAELEQTIN